MQVSKNLKKSLRLCNIGTKTLAQSTKQETSDDILEIQAKEETLLPKKYRSESNERAKNSSKTVGYVQNKEEPELFEDSR